MIAILGIAFLVTSVLSQAVEVTSLASNTTSLERCSGVTPTPTTRTIFVITTSVGFNFGPKLCEEETITATASSCIIVNPPIVTETVTVTRGALCDAPILGDCGDTCSNLCTDPENCGDCGRKCKGTCVNAACSRSGCAGSVDIQCAPRCYCEISAGGLPFCATGPRTGFAQECITDKECPLGDLCAIDVTGEGPRRCLTSCDGFEGFYGID